MKALLSLWSPLIPVALLASSVPRRPRYRPRPPPKYRKSHPHGVGSFQISLLGDGIRRWSVRRFALSVRWSRIVCRRLMRCENSRPVRGTDACGNGTRPENRCPAFTSRFACFACANVEWTTDDDQDSGDDGCKQMLGDSVCGIFHRIYFLALNAERPTKG